MKKINFKIAENGIKKLSKSVSFNTISAVNEFIHNSFDADASKTIIVYDDCENYLSFIDDGKGMNEDEFNNHYLTAFNTDKENDNNAIGNKGIGGSAALLYFHNENDELSKIEIICKKDGYKAIKVISRDGVNFYLEELEDSPIERGCMFTIYRPTNVTNIHKDCIEQLPLYHYPQIYRGKNIIFKKSKDEDGYIMPKEDPLYYDILPDDSKLKKNIEVTLENGEVGFVIVRGVCVRYLEDKKDLWNSFDRANDKLISEKTRGLYVRLCNTYTTLGQSDNTFGVSIQPSASAIRLEIEVTKNLSSLFSFNINKTSKISPFAEIKELKEVVDTLKQYHQQLTGQDIKKEEVILNDINKFLNGLNQKINGMPYVCHIVENTSNFFNIRTKIENNVFNYEIGININHNDYNDLRNKWQSEGKHKIFIQNCIKILANEVNCFVNNPNNPTKKELEKLTKAINNHYKTLLM